MCESTKQIILEPAVSTQDSNEWHHQANGVHQYNNELSELFTRFWDLDQNRCQPGTDYSIDLQGYVTNTNLASRDYANRKFFSMFDEDKVFARATYRAFRSLLDNYEMDTSKTEVVTPEEERENQDFINLITDTPVMKEAHRFLVAHNKVPADVNGFKKKLYKIWFLLYRRSDDTGATVSNNSSGFEHVFVGETRGKDVIGFHNWIQLYLQEKISNIDYRGFFRRGTTEEMERSPRVVTLQFQWKKTGGGKPIGSSFIGTSPEFEMALYTTMFLMNLDRVFVHIKRYDLELVCHRLGQGIGTAFPMSHSD